MTLYRKDLIDGNEKHTLLQVKSLHFWRATGAEFIGSFFLIFIGIAPLIASDSEDSYLWKLALSGVCFISVTFALVHIIGPVSGCNVNPVVTFAFVLTRRLHPVKGLMYALAQVGGK